MKVSILFIGITAFLLVSCDKQKEQTHNKDMQSDNTHMNAEEHEHSSHEIENRNVVASIEKTGVLADLIDSYLLLKDALVSDDTKKAATTANLMLKAFKSFDMSSLTEKQHIEYMEIAENSQEQLEHIIKNPIDHQREYFEVLSNDLNDLIILVGTDKHLYQDFCPMYNNKKGAYWISATAEISNPYYGSKMTNCGNVHKEIN